MRYDDDDLLLVGECARLVGVSHITMRKYIDRARLPGRRTPSGIRLVRYADVIAFKATQQEARHGSKAA